MPNTAGTPSPTRSNHRRERDATPELKGSGSARLFSKALPTRSSADASSAAALPGPGNVTSSPARSHHSHSRSHRDRERGDRDEREKSSSSRRRERSPVDEEEEEEARRRRRRRERQREEEEAAREGGGEDAETEERRRRRREREREDERGSSRRDRSRESGRSGGRDREREREKERERDRPDREERERERERRDREMKAEAREKEEHYARIDRERQQERDRDRRRGPPPPDREDFPPRSPPRRRRGSPSYDQSAAANDVNALLDEVDAEARSVFVSQIAGKLTSRDLGMFFEDMLGDNTVRDARIVTDRVSRRSKGIGYVELATVELVEKAIALSGTIVMGLPILVELTEAERNRQAAAIAGVPGAPLTGPGSLPPLPGLSANVGGGNTGLHRDRHFGAEIPYHRLYVGSLNFDLTADDMKQVFEPFGELEFVDLHREPLTGKSKGFCFVQFMELESAKSALQTMNGFELAGRQLRVSTVNEKAGAPARPTAAPSFMTGANASGLNGAMPESLEEHHGQRMDHAARQALMQKLARTDAPSNVHPSRLTMVPINNKPVIPVQPSVYILANNMFNPAEETERDWDTDLAEDIKGECENKYGKVLKIKVEKESQGEVYIQFDSLASAGKAVEGLNGRFFGGRSLVANYLPEVLFKAHVN